ncbi:hypothetical protein T552_04054 [Pneumocystis carinii B80]|uniref:Kri1-like C-terminal domain-containing protein n=1 Tax=Pneumocystis carinii (strain B80) TaxID=1408658 RepID=A0A0W4ZSZ3_PNEC8|nr:hypothetical protein T552_04054 [Pneumocystis carinii B80]KTW31490.1 hypothetical protein T552_04054 [Pneumocystis carinii B80]
MHLLSDHDDLDDLDKIDINEAYAKRYEHNKAREELHRCGFSPFLFDFENTESSETEDEIGDFATPSMNAAILETILKIRSKDPDIYKSDVNFYENVDDELIIKEKSKPLLLNDYHRQRLLDPSKNEMEEEEKMDVSDPTYVEEQRMLKEEVLAAFNEETHDDDFLTLRKKSLQEQEEEDKAYKDFLMEKVEDKARKEILQQWIDVSNKSVDESNEKLSKDTEDDHFLLSYVLNRGWIDKNANRVASYDQVIKGLESDESFDEKVDEFEAKYNFRFEEDVNQISSYSRDIVSVRRKNEKRKHMREKKNQLKHMEKLKKEEEIFRLKNLKRKELMEKLNKIAQVTGDPTLKFEDIDIEGDFDPDKWSARMDEIFNEAYYSKKEKKPVFEDDTDIECIDSDYGEPMKNNSDTEINSIVSQENQMKSKKNISAAKLLKKEKENRKRKLDFMLDQHYNVNIKKTGTFKYNNVDTYNFGLNHADILYANDAELNEFVSLKKLTPYKNEKLQEKDRKKYGRKKRLKEWRKKVWGEYLDNHDIVENNNTNMSNDKKFRRKKDV